MRARTARKLKPVPPIIDDTTDAVIARARVADPVLDRLCDSVEHICQLRAELARRITSGQVDDPGVYVRIATEVVLWRSRAEKALRDIAL